MQKMKLKMLVAAVLTATSLTSTAAPLDVSFYGQPFTYISVAAGPTLTSGGTTDPVAGGLVASPATPGVGGMLPAPGATSGFTAPGVTSQPVAELRLGVAQAITVFPFDGSTSAVGGSLNLLAIHGKLVASPQADFFYQPRIESVFINPHISVSDRTGFAAGVDLLIPIFKDDQNMLKVGFTQFQKSVDGTSGVVTVGAVPSLH